MTCLWSKEKKKKDCIERLHGMILFMDFQYEGMKEKILDSYYYGNVK